MITKITNYIKGILNKTPMYLLVGYVLMFYTAYSFILSFLGKLDFTPLSLLYSLVILLFICIGLNFACAKLYKLPVQHQSSLITALILFLIFVPAESTENILALVLAATVATLSKYIFVWRNTHIFNPAAIGIFATTIFSMGSAFWWVGNFYFLPIILIGGFIIIYKTRRFELFYAGLISSLLAIGLQSYFYNLNLLDLLYSTYFSGPIIFFLTIMLTEPHTIAKNKNQQIFYGFLIPILPTLAGFTNIFNLAPESSLLIGNILSFVFSKRERFVLKLKSISKLNDSTFEYIFDNYTNKFKNFKFKAGEYLEWTLDHKNPDNRSIRRYFTISSAPGSGEIKFATKFPPADESTFKKALKEIKIGDKVYATQLGGDFLLPKNSKTNLALIAGGIGITPFISQLRDLENKQEHRNITLFYCVRGFADIAYVEEIKNIINTDKINLRIVFVVGEENKSLEESYKNFFYEYGFLKMEILNKYLQNLTNTQFYISGPNSLVDMLKTALHTSKVSNNNIHTDYFPGF
jgi:ferredoxin-NADP reductase/Na+-translocating ferredoxin:NAD+ oxidoreductase RnfD subunit